VSAAGGGSACISLSAWLPFDMLQNTIFKGSVKDPRLPEKDRLFWRQMAGEDRLSAVEVLRRQFGKFPAGEGYDGSQRLRRVLRVVQ
jgi:hypothetical protein